MSARAYIYNFGSNKADGSASMNDLLGGKGANLAEMCNIKLPIPPGFTITTQVCKYYYDHNYALPSNFDEELNVAIQHLEDACDYKFSDNSNPLLVSVRSGAPISMPGMMDTILNLGLNDKSVLGFIQQNHNERFAYDSYRRFIQMYGNIVLGIKLERFEEILFNEKIKCNIKHDYKLGAESLLDIIQNYKTLIKDNGHEIPQDPKVQLKAAINAVFKSWMNERAIQYRRIHKIPGDLYTAINIQKMVFGNMGDNSATGVAFTRDPSTGERMLFGEYLINAQGEDVVAGIRTPDPINADEPLSMKNKMPAVYQELLKIKSILEDHYRDMQDIEFTVENGKLWLLQTRCGKRSINAGVKIVVDMVEEGLISRQEAILRINPESINQLLHPILDPKFQKCVIAKGLPASPGAVSGKVVFSAEEAERQAHNGAKVVLVRNDTSPEDINGMYAAVGIITTRGGMTSHAAVVARGMGRPCICSASNITIFPHKKHFVAGQHTVNTDDNITINGSTGEIILGTVPTTQPEFPYHFSKLMEWADEIRKIKVLANADSPSDAKIARNFGAEGIGLCRTEHMFFDQDRISIMRKMIMSSTYEERKLALQELQVMQKNDFTQIFSAMHDLPVTIRLLDPPLHEFLPCTEKAIQDMAAAIDIPEEYIKNRAIELREINPMLGHRGCRIGISYPEIYEMQFSAILESVAESENDICPEIMIPLIMNHRELVKLKTIAQRIRDIVSKKYNKPITYKLGAMIELPSAALTADEIAEHAEFFSFGTNDLTQTTLGISRDDSAHFINIYRNQDIINIDPFVEIEKKSVGSLMKMAIQMSRKIRPDLKIGICGEHGGNPESIYFCSEIDIDYVSCSPYRVPIARLAAAHCAIKLS